MAYSCFSATFDIPKGIVPRNIWHPVLLSTCPITTSTREWRTDISSSSTTVNHQQHIDKVECLIDILKQTPTEDEEEKLSTDSSLVIKIMVLSFRVCFFFNTWHYCKHSRKAPVTECGLWSLWLRAAFIVRLHWSSDTKWSFSKAHYYFIHSVVLLLLIGDIPGGKGSQRTIARDARESARDSILSCSSRSAPATSTWPGDCDAEHWTDTELTITPGRTAG